MDSDLAKKYQTMMARLEAGTARRLKLRVRVPPFLDPAGNARL